MPSGVIGYELLYRKNALADSTTEAMSAETDGALVKCPVQHRQRVPVRHWHHQLHARFADRRASEIVDPERLVRGPAIDGNDAAQIAATEVLEQPTARFPAGLRRVRPDRPYAAAASAGVLHQARPRRLKPETSRPLRCIASNHQHRGP